MAQGGEDESSADGSGEGEETRWCGLTERELVLTIRHKSEIASLVASHTSALWDIMEMAENGEDESSAGGSGEDEEARWRHWELALTARHKLEVEGLVASHTSAIMVLQTAASEEAELVRLQIEKLEAGMAAAVRVAELERDAAEDYRFHALNSEAVAKDALWTIVRKWGPPDQWNLDETDPSHQRLLAILIEEVDRMGDLDEFVAAEHGGSDEDELAAAQEQIRDDERREEEIQRILARRDQAAADHAAALSAQLRRTDSAAAAAAEEATAAALAVATAKREEEQEANRRSWELHESTTEDRHERLVESLASQHFPRNSNATPEYPCSFFSAREKSGVSSREDLGAQSEALKVQSLSRPGVEYAVDARCTVLHGQ